MSIASEYNGHDPNNVVVDRQDWENSFDDVLENSPKTADDLAHLLFYLLHAIETATDGYPDTRLDGSADRLADGLPRGLGERLNKVKNSLWEEIEYAYLNTGAHKLALKLYLLYMDGSLMKGDNPGELIGGAVQRGIEFSKRSRRKRKKNRLDSSERADKSES
ncbi:MAG: hypothetical protein ACREDR_19130 [Blastocatellia bacterium]